MPPIVQIVQHLRPGGLEVMALDLLELQGGHLVSLEGDMRSAVATWPRLAAIADRLCFLGKPPGWSPRTLSATARALRRLKPAAVHTHHIGPLLYGGIAARSAGVSCVIHTEHDAWYLGDRRMRRVHRLALTLARPTTVAVSAMVRDAIRHHHPGLDLRVIANGVDTARFHPADAVAARQRLGLPGRVRLLGCAARLEAVKGVDILLDALALLPADIHLAIAGEGSLASPLRARAQALGLEARTHFLGLVLDMAGFYPALDMFCLPSRAEGLPLAALEAQACGVACVAADVGGCREAICPSSGRLVRPEDPAALARALLEGLVSTASDPRIFILRNNDLRRTADAYRELASRPARVA